MSDSHRQQLLQIDKDEVLELAQLTACVAARVLSPVLQATTLVYQEAESAVQGRLEGISKQVFARLKENGSARRWCWMHPEALADGKRTAVTGREEFVDNIASSERFWGIIRESLPEDLASYLPSRWTFGDSDAERDVAKLFRTALTVTLKSVVAIPDSVGDDNLAAVAFILKELHTIAPQLLNAMVSPLRFIAGMHRINQSPSTPAVASNPVDNLGAVPVDKLQLIRRWLVYELQDLRNTDLLAQLEVSPSMRGPELCLGQRSAGQLLQPAPPQPEDGVPGGSGDAWTDCLLVKTAHLPRACALLQSNTALPAVTSDHVPMVTLEWLCDVKPWRDVDSTMRAMCHMMAKADFDFLGDTEGKPGESEFNARATFYPMAEKVLVDALEAVRQDSLTHDMLASLCTRLDSLPHLPAADPLKDIGPTVEGYAVATARLEHEFLLAEGVVVFAKVMLERVLADRFVAEEKLGVKAPELEAVNAQLEELSARSDAHNAETQLVAKMEVIEARARHQKLQAKLQAEVQAAQEAAKTANNQGADLYSLILTSKFWQSRILALTAVLRGLGRNAAPAPTPAAGNGVKSPRELAICSPLIELGKVQSAIDSILSQIAAAVTAIADKPDRRGEAMRALVALQERLNRQLTCCEGLSDMLYASCTAVVSRSGTEEGIPEHLMALVWRPASAEGPTKAPQRLASAAVQPAVGKAAAAPCGANGSPAQVPADLEACTEPALDMPALVDRALVHAPEVAGPLFPEETGASRPRSSQLIAERMQEVCGARPLDATMGWHFPNTGREAEGWLADAWLGAQQPKQLSKGVYPAMQCNVCEEDLAPEKGTCVCCVLCMRRYAHYACAFVAVAPWVCKRCAAEAYSASGIPDALQGPGLDCTDVPGWFMRVYGTLAAAPTKHARSDAPRQPAEMVDAGKPDSSDWAGCGMGMLSSTARAVGSQVMPMAPHVYEVVCEVLLDMSDAHRAVVAARPQGAAVGNYAEAAALEHWRKDIWPQLYTESEAARIKERLCTLRGNALARLRISRFVLAVVARSIGRLACHDRPALDLLAFVLKPFMQSRLHDAWTQWKVDAAERHQESLLAQEEEAAQQRAQAATRRAQKQAARAQARGAGEAASDAPGDAAEEAPVAAKPAGQNGGGLGSQRRAETAWADEEWAEALEVARREADAEREAAEAEPSDSSDGGDWNMVGARHRAPRERERGAPRGGPRAQSRDDEAAGNVGVRGRRSRRGAPGGDGAEVQYAHEVVSRALEGLLAPAMAPPAQGPPAQGLGLAQPKEVIKPPVRERPLGRRARQQEVARAVAEARARVESGRALVEAALAKGKVDSIPNALRAQIRAAARQGSGGDPRPERRGRKTREGGEAGGDAQSAEGWSDTQQQQQQRGGRRGRGGDAQGAQRGALAPDAARDVHWGGDADEDANSDDDLGCLLELLGPHAAASNAPAAPVEPTPPATQPQLPPAARAPMPGPEANIKALASHIAARAVQAAPRRPSTEAQRSDPDPAPPPMPPIPPLPHLPLPAVPAKAAAAKGLERGTDGGAAVRPPAADIAAHPRPPQHLLPSRPQQQQQQQPPAQQPPPLPTPRQPNAGAPRVSPRRAEGPPPRISPRRPVLPPGEPDLAAAMAAADAGEDIEHLDVFRCPISLEIMKDPVMAADGHTYERRSIESWLESHDTSPLTNAKLDHLYLTPNHTLRAVIHSMCTR
ncbi:hypothetical protein WJX81_001302 [Elliptochloris bilobata]|uniref:U-box domain-containing protein n=1 Tax=Elliptochloris bilobata TaxID=381761 RepID=A0AAW1QKH4_9CHLO